ncbi:MULTISPECIES: metalloprotease [unclassified Halorhabdus]|uniref:metalloprotease n=1 Tax=unclassified Halorhabdus TaxID=2621901 RepID=UPI0023DC8E2C|nr:MULTISPECIES: metalloprotease [unclassified Halorhabdus]WEL17313.1 Zn-dependent protease [Halorhabdus sp. SVX81]WEL21196.1 Zn-dependent protease [Halorhabdus sp. BNX81]
MSGLRSIRFSRKELFDLLAAWLILSVAFTLFLNPGLLDRWSYAPDPSVVIAAFGESLVTSLLTVGVGFMLHELAHKVVAIRYGQVAAFQADYGMLFLALVSAMAGFLFAAPGAVVHRGRLTLRESGLIALAGPVTNLALASCFAPFALLAGPGLASVASFGVTINLLLAGFNMIPYGPLDGRTVLKWNRGVYLAVAVPSIALAIVGLFGLGF